MHDRLLLARWFLAAGVVLAVAGLAAWRALPGGFPPYLVTAALALGYGAACRWGRWKDGGAGKP